MYTCTRTHTHIPGGMPQAVSARANAPLGRVCTLLRIILEHIHTYQGACRSRRSAPAPTVTIVHAEFASPASTSKHTRVEAVNSPSRNSPPPNLGCSNCNSGTGGSNCKPGPGASASARRSAEACNKPSPCGPPSTAAERRDLTRTMVSARRECSDLPSVAASFKSPVQTKN